MTCMPASRRARATTLTPRSWPSSPTLARTTRIGTGVDMADALLVRGRASPSSYAHPAVRSPGTGRLDKSALVTTAPPSQRPRRPEEAGITGRDVRPETTIMRPDEAPGESDAPAFGQLFQAGAGGTARRGTMNRFDGEFSEIPDGFSAASMQELG